MNDRTRLLMDTECEKDYEKRHCWEKLGVVSGVLGIYLVWQCSQCRKCVLEELEFQTLATKVNENE